jgi:hypothetical protein
MIPPTRRFSRYRNAWLGAGLVTASLFAGCSGDEKKEEGGAASACLSDRAFFESKVWASFMSEKCARCHTPDGEAVNEKGAKLVLQTASYPSFLDANLESLRQASNEKFGDKIKLLEKPIGGLEHGGGPVLEPGGPEHQALQELVRRFQSGDPCPDARVASIDGVELLSGPETARKAAIDLAGRLPTGDEEASAKDDAALDAFLDKLMTEETFYERIREIYNDLFLTDRFLSYNGAAIDFMDTKDMYPSLAPYRNDQAPEYSSPDRPRINRAIAKEPLNIITYVVKNDRPFTEILTADYTVVNPFLAKAYGVQASFSDPTNENEFQQAKVVLGTGEALPHAGVLSTPVFLNRWMTSPTNRNRGRARRVYQFFLATDILKIAERPVDPSAATAHENPTMTDKNCVMCHKIMDPIAGGFRGYDDNNYENFQGSRPWFGDMVAPGYGGTMLPPESYATALPWMARQVVQDPRFVIAAINAVYTGITGHKPLAYPTDAVDAPGHDLRVAAWSAQDAFFRALGEEFKAQNFNLKVVFKGIIKSPYYRGKTLTAAPGDKGELYEGIGTGRWLTPEMLNRKIQATLGVPWRKRWEWDNIIKDKNEGKDLRLGRGLWLLDDFKLLYGGIDSDNVPFRLQTPNGISASVAWRMANEMACAAVPWDFWKPKDQRRLFPVADPKDRPEFNNKAVGEAQQAIKANLTHLHRVLLGEALSPEDPEIKRSFDLFLETWRELAANESQKDKKQDLPWECHARYDYDNLAFIPDDQQIRKDEDYTIRAWMAVTTYLLLDHRFLYH